jgi:hypothetical protein
VRTVLPHSSVDAPVGDSPEGPLKNRGNPAKNLQKTKTKHTSYLNARTGHDPRCGGPRGPPEWPSRRPPRAGSASLEGSRLPRAGSASLEGSRLPQAGSAGSNHDVRTAGAPSPPLLVLCGRPCPCSATPSTAATTPVLLNTRGRDAATPATVPRTDHRQLLPRARLETPQPTTTPSASKPPLFEYGTRHDDKTGAKTARTAANSAALNAILPYVAKECGMLVTHPLLGL